MNKAVSDAQHSDSNWGRWGKEDERGAANFATAERIKNAATSLVRSGKVYSLAIPLQNENVPVLPPRAAPQHFMRLDGGDYAAGLKRKGGFQTSDDFIALGTHTTTHIDALAHVWYDDKLYNDFSANTVRSNGARHCGIDKLVHLVGRGVLIDLCAHRGLPSLPRGDIIKPEHIEDCATAQGIDVRQGDILLIRTGWMDVFHKDGREAFFKGEPGIGRDAAEWIGARGIAAVGVDNWGVEVIPVEGDVPGPVHRRLIRDYGVYLMELFRLDELAADRVYEFLFVAAPLRITGGVGSPLNPLAIA
jgi:kynurenine formamidase